MGDAYGRPDAVSLLIYTGDEIPSHRQTEIFADRAVDGIWSVLVNVAELSYQLKKVRSPLHLPYISSISPELSYQLRKP